MTFIHAVVGPPTEPESGRADVERMLRGVVDGPWEATGVAVFHGRTTTCVLGMQVQPDAHGVRADRITRSADSNVGIVADLRLDERDDLVRKLRIGSSDARHLSDAELVLLAHQRWGADGVAHLLGTGVFALWDGHEEQLLCWRDAAGTRPLYYQALASGRLIVSSDLRSLTAHPAVSTTLDLAYARSLLEVGPVFQHPERTLLDGVRKLPAGHLMTAGAGRSDVRSHWSPEQVPERRHKHAADYVEELQELLTCAVASHVHDAGEPVGAHLSGGLDSSSVAVLAARRGAERGRETIGFSWAPPWAEVPEIEHDERRLVESVASFAGVGLRYTHIEAADLVTVSCLDLAVEPMTTLHFEHPASRRAAQTGIRSMLSGWGGDELVVFNGRGYFADLARRWRWPTIIRELRARAAIHGGTVGAAVRGRVVRPLLPDAILHRIRPEEQPGPAPLPPSLKPDFAALLREVDPLPELDVRERPGVRRMQVALLTCGHLQYRMESWAAHGARFGMRYGFPLLDRRIIEFALGIPEHLYFKDGWKRWLYRTAMQGILPDEVRWNPDKQDATLNVRLSQIGAAARAELAHRLRDRSDNPFVDVDGLLAGSFARTPRSAVVRHDDGDAGGTRTANDPTWLAFTRVTPP